MALMEELSFRNLLASSATVSTVLQFLTGLLICYKYIKKKSTGDTSGFPFVAGFLSCFLWFKYGILTQEHIVIFVNAIGSGLFFSYVLIYFTFSVNKRVILRQFLGVCCFILVCTIYTSYELNSAKAIEVIGIVCCCVGVLFFASPLTKLAHVMRTKNAESLPFPIITASFFVSLQWFIYGLIIDDMFIQVPNLLGCILSSIQLFLCILYPSRKWTSIKGGASYQPLRSQDNIL